MIELPYFDAILEACRRDAVDVARAWGRNTHWGYWADPTTANGSVDDFVAASEAMTRLVCDVAGVRDGMSVLDVGCGFGGVVASLNDRFQDLKLTGLNIDPRQIARAQREVTPRGTNSIQFVVGDACALALPDASFDVVLAVECIFHFPSRVRFMREARRVLKPGGVLMISEYVAQVLTLPLLAACGLANLRTIEAFYGKDTPIPPACYDLFAWRTGFERPVVADISANVLPTFPFLIDLLPRFPLDGAALEGAIHATRVIGEMSARRWMRYQVFTFRTAT